MVVIQKLDFVSQKQLVKDLMSLKYFSLLKTVAMVLLPNFPLMKLAFKRGPDVFLKMLDIFKYDTDNTMNERLVSMFYGKLCDISTDGSCSIALGHYLLRVFKKNPVQALMHDNFTMKISCCEEHSIEKCCHMCQNLFQAACRYEFDAVEHFLKNPM